MGTMDVAIEDINDIVTSLDGRFPDLSAAVVDRILWSIAEGTPVILRRLWTVEVIDAVRAELTRRAREDFYEQVDITAGCRNFIRHDGEEKRHRFHRDHLYRRFYGLPWNHDARSVFDAVGRGLVALRNRLLNQPDDAFVAAPYVPYYAHWTAIQYPPGGGFLIEHRDVCEPGAELECLLSLSQHGEDFTTGGLFIHDGLGRKLHLDPMLNKGDLFIFNQSLPHGIDPVDPAERIDWDSAAGRWSMFIPVRPSPWG